jgi:diguanylate cyclase
MTVSRDEHERTLAFAETALGQIRALVQPASPRNFEIWYTYATGYNSALNRAINTALEQTGALNEADLEVLYAAHVSTTRVGERIDSVGSRVLEEIRQVLGVIDTAAGSASSYSEKLADASAELAGASDADALRAAAKRLMEGAKQMALNNKKLEASLSASKQEIEQLQENLVAVRNETFTDPLTSLSNRKFFDVALVKVMAEATEKNQPLSLMMADVDHFKFFNDRYGHLTGDQVLRLVAISMKQNVKGRDIAARYGGEEFVIALPDTALRPATTVADQIRRAIMAKELMKRSNGERLGRVTVSIGVAVLRADDTPHSLIERADNCLYAAKRNGRNRVVCESDPQADSGAARVA